MLKNDVQNRPKDDEDFAMLKTLIKNKLGFNCEYYKDSHFKRRIDVRLRASGSKNYGEYVKLLKENENERNVLSDTLTVNVTNFFRNTEVYDIVEKEILPAVIKSKASSTFKTINIWSAGCSIGVEGFSIAMLLHHVLGPNIKNYKITITGTDIDRGSLQQAQQGIYGEGEIKDVRPAFLKKYFVQQGNKYQVIDELRKMTQFRSHDMISGPKMKGFDIIFCRNVTIYFEKELQEKLYMNFYDGLNEGGFFVMGKTETLLGPSKNLFNAYNAKERIYRK